MIYLSHVTIPLQANKHTPNRMNGPGKALLFILQSGKGRNFKWRPGYFSKLLKLSLLAESPSYVRVSFFLRSTHNNCRLMTSFIFDELVPSV